MKHNTGHQIIDFAAAENPIQITPHKHMLDSSMENTLWHEQIELKLFYSSGDELVIGNKVFLTEVNDIYVINTCEPHSSPKTNEKTDYHLLIIDTSKIMAAVNTKKARILNSICSGEIIFNNRIQGNKYLQGLIEEIVAHWEKNKYDYDMKCSGLLLLILDELVNNESTLVNTDMSYKNKLYFTQKLSPAITVMSNEFERKINLSELAELCGWNEKYFCRVFRQLTGMTAIEYINNLRINKAEVLISTTDKPLTEISEICGYSDVTYFSRKFKEIKGYAPSKIKNNRRSLFKSQENS